MYRLMAAWVITSAGTLPGTTRSGSRQPDAGKDGRKVTISGKFCESGDILIRDIELPTMKAGDILAVAGTGSVQHT